jgi:hypothetical protein
LPARNCRASQRRFRFSARAVEVEVPAIDPELAEPEAHGVVGVQEFARRIDQRDLSGQLVLGRVDVPELLGLPLLGDGDAAAVEVAGP